MTLTDANQMVVTDGPWVGATIDTAWTTLPQALDAAAERWRERPALHFIDTGHVESWAELNRHVLTAAAGLHAMGVRPGDRVGILLGNVVEFPHAWLGILAVGAVAVPMNPAYTTREVAFVVDDTGMTAAVAAAEHAELIDGLPESATLDRRRTVIVGDESPGWGVPWSTLMSAEPWQRPYSLGRPDDLANIQYTSGTTGLPKGCMLTHLYWSVLGRTGAQILGLGTSNVLADHPFFYLQNQSYFANAVTTGAQLHVTPSLSLSRYVGWLHEFDIDLAWVSDGLLGLPESELDATHRLRLAPSDVIDPALHAALEQRFNLVAREWYASTEIGLGTISPWDDTSAVGSGSMGLPGPVARNQDDRRTGPGPPARRSRRTVRSRPGHDARLLEPRRDQR
jgi:acyl-CoA synthetase (AMP-forming)/AMP-acid ligase II